MLFFPKNNPIHYSFHYNPRERGFTMTNYVKTIAIILGLCFTLFSSTQAFSQEKEQSKLEENACKTALKSCKAAASAMVPVLAAQWVACKAVRICKKDCRIVKKECKQEARSTKKQCKQQCKDRFGSGKKFRECKRDCKDDKKETKQECKSEKRVCTKDCRITFLTPECKAARTATITAGGLGAISCAAVIACINKEEEGAGGQ